MAHSREEHKSAHELDLLAAVVLHVLVTGGRGGIGLEQLAKGCERDPADPAALREVDEAAQILVADGLASWDGDSYRPTRAALRAAQLSF